MQAITLINPGANAKLERKEIPTPQPKKGELLIKIGAFGVNRADLLQKMGRYPPPVDDSPLLGLELCGQVVAVGDPNDRHYLHQTIFGLVAGGAYAEYAVISTVLAIPLWSNFSVIEGAAIAETFITAYQTLFHYGQLQPQHHVLIHAGASGVGSAAIQLAKAAGAEVFTTVGSQKKVAFCQALGAQHVINYHELNFIDYCKPFGIDIILDCVAGDYLDSNLRCLNSQGKIIMIAMLAARYSQLDMAKLLAKQAQIIASTLRNQSLSIKASFVTQLLQQFGAHFQQRLILPTIDSVYSWDDIEQAHQHMANNLNQGKIVITIN